MPRWQRPATGAWNGVNLGGWLLLEPGPSEPLFSNHPDKKGEKAKCEWDLMKILRRKKDKTSINEHRNTFITRDDFERIRACGLNAVRLPFGYWCVLGPVGDDPYQGPCLEIIDQALDWAEEFGLQVMLDLHGCPGGESGEVPCGRQNHAWSWRQWRIGQSLQALEVVALRYKDRKCVTGIAVCNEPSGDIPQGHILRYYAKAVELVRKCGMSANQVAVVLPVWMRDYEPFIKAWTSLTQGRHKNVCFEDHFYQCFDDYSHGLTFAQHLRSVQKSIRDLRKYPMVIGEWSLALGQNAMNTPLGEKELRKQFCLTQIETYKAASHGWFFWNWKDGNGPEWNFQEAFEEGSFSGPAPTLPLWNGKGEDPLENELWSKVDRQICFGDPIFLRGFHGCCMDAEKCQVLARWPDHADWQRFTLHAPLGASQTRRQILHGDNVRICSHSDRFLHMSENGQLSADKRDFKGLSEFIVHTSNKQPLRHGQAIFLESRAESCMINTGDEDDVVRVQWKDFGEWQRWTIEKDFESPQLIESVSAAESKALAAHEFNESTPSSKRNNSLKNTLDEALVMTPPKAKRPCLRKPNTCENTVPVEFEMKLQVEERHNDKVIEDLNSIQSSSSKLPCSFLPRSSSPPLPSITSDAIPVSPIHL